MATKTASPSPVHHSADDERLSAAQAAKLLGVSTDTIHRRIAAKTLEAEDVREEGSRQALWRIPHSVVLAQRRSNLTEDERIDLHVAAVLDSWPRTSPDKRAEVAAELSAAMAGGGAS